MPSKSKNSKGKRQVKNVRALPLTAGPPLYNNKRCTLVFCAKHQQLEGAVSAGVYNSYRLNGPYDPDTAVLSNSTPGLASIAALYRSMRVWKTTVSVHACAYADAPASLMLSLVPTAFQPVLPSNPDYWPVQRDAASVVMKPGAYVGSGTLVCFDGTVTKTFDLAHVANILKSQYLDEADFASVTNSNPTRQLYCAIAVSTNSNTAVNCRFHVRIAYDIEFYDPYPLQ